jgi:VWFA-related protein
MVGSALGLLVAVPRAQPKAGPQQTTTPRTLPARPVFRAGVAYVAVDVVVTDKRGKPVTNLTARDFEIRDGGRIQALTNFAHVSIPTDRHKIDPGATPAAPADAFANSPPVLSSRAFVFAIDDGAVPPEELVNVKRVMTEFLERLAPADRAAVVFPRRSDLGQDFTSDAGRLIEAVDRTRAAVGWAPDARATRLWLDSVVMTLADVPETRRALVYVSDGFRTCPAEAVRDLPAVMGQPCTGLDVPHDVATDVFTPAGLRDLFERAWLADVAVYTLSPRGILAPALGFDGHLEDQTPQRRFGIDVANRADQQFQLTLAGNTGGLAFVNVPDLRGAAARIIADNSDYYVLGFSPSPYVADDRFRAIDVQVVTRQGLQVRARKGYIAEAPDATATPESALNAALARGADVSDLSLRAFAAPLAPSARGVQTALTVEVRYPPVPAGTSRLDDDLQWKVLALDPDAGVKASSSHTLHVSGAAPATGEATFLIDDLIDLPAQVLTLRIGVASRALGRTGTIHLPLTVPALAAHDLQMSGIAIGTAAPGAEPALDAGALRDVLPFQPTVSRAFAPSDTLRLFGRLFWGAADTAATVTIAIRRDGKVVGRPRMLAVDGAVSAPRRSTAVLDTTLPLAGLSPGAYVLTIAAHLSAGKTAVREIPFTVR